MSAQQRVKYVVTSESIERLARQHGVQLPPSATGGAAELGPLEVSAVPLAMDSSDVHMGGLQQAAAAAGAPFKGALPLAVPALASVAADSSSVSPPPAQRRDGGVLTADDATRLLELFSTPRRPPATTALAASSASVGLTQQQQQQPLDSAVSVAALLLSPSLPEGAQSELLLQQHIIVEQRRVIRALTAADGKKQATIELLTARIAALEQQLLEATAFAGGRTAATPSPPERERGISPPAPAPAGRAAVVRPSASPNRHELRASFTNAAPLCDAGLVQLRSLSSVQSVPTTTPPHRLLHSPSQQVLQTGSLPAQRLPVASPVRSWASSSSPPHRVISPHQRSALPTAAAATTTSSSSNARPLSEGSAHGDAAALISSSTTTTTTTTSFEGHHRASVEQQRLSIAQALRRSVERREQQAASAEATARAFAFTSMERQRKVEALLQKLDEIRQPMPS